MAVMEPFKLEAQLLRGVAVEPYGLDLSGILASRLWRLQKEKIRDLNQDNFTDSMTKYPQDLDLPLDICDVGSEWHWTCTCAIYTVDEKYPQEPRTFYKVVNDRWMSNAARRPLPYYSPKAGAYRDVMMPAHIMLTGKLTWYGVGNIAEIKKLVSPIRFLGKRRSKGEGKILQWNITQMETNNAWALAHQGEDKLISRPVPVECANKLGLEYDLDWFAIRPPSWNPERLTELAIQKQPEIYFPEEWEL